MNIRHTPLSEVLDWAAQASLLTRAELDQAAEFIKAASQALDENRELSLDDLPRISNRAAKYLLLLITLREVER